MEKENNDNVITKSRSYTKYKKQSVWERFMTLYMCILPPVVCIYYIYYVFLSICNVTNECIGIPLNILYLPVTLYTLSVFFSYIIIPTIFLCVKVYDYFKLDRNKKYNVKSRESYRKMSFFYNRFRYSFIGEIFYIFLYFIMIGMIIFIDELWVLLNIFHIETPGIGGLAGLMYGMECFILNYVVSTLFLIIIFYVLIRRICEYKKEKAKRKKLNAIKRKELQVSKSQPDEQLYFDEEKASEK